MKVKTKIKALAILLILSAIVFACGFSVTGKTYAEDETSVVSSVVSESGSASQVASSPVNDTDTNLSCNSNNGWIIWVVFGVVVVAFFAYSWWKNKKTATQRDEQKKKLDALPAGTEIITIGMIKGKIVKNEGDYIVIETGDDENKSYLQVHKNGIYQIFSDDTDASSDENVTESEEVVQEKSEESVAETNDKEVFSDFKEVKTEENTETADVSETKKDEEE